MMQVGGAILPPEYQQVEWIMGTGSQYILLTFGGVYEDEEFEMDFWGNGLDRSQSSLFAFGQVNYPKSPRAGDMSFINALICNSSSWGMIGYRDTVRKKSVVYKYESGRAQVIVDGYKNYDSPLVNTTYQVTNSKFGLFSYYDGNGIRVKNGYDTARLTYFSRKVNGEYYWQLYPCYRKMDNKRGMYDIVNDVFYTNNGTGEFEIGAEV